MNNDADHAIELQLGGKDVTSNMMKLNGSVNRSTGSQISGAIRREPLAHGIKVRNVKFVDPD
ncbi:MAG: hypothetical protein P1V20_22790 [Verrucomicrobiales bacterium]|nr:hypothetical protein [Verrucomicrobiales bacterium]